MPTLTLPPPPAQNAAQADPGAPHRFVCGACELESLAPVSRPEAAFLAGIHDRVHHGGPPTAEVFPA